MTADPPPIVVRIRPESLPMAWLGVVVNVPLTIWLLRAAVAPGSAWLAGLAAFRGALALFGTGVLHLAYRGPRQVTLAADGVLTFPTWFGLGTRTLDLSDVVEAHTGPERIVLKCRAGVRGAGWSRVLFGGPAMAGLSHHIGGWLDARK